MLVVFSPTFVADTKIMFGYNIAAPEAAMRRYSVEKVFLKHLQNSEDNACARASFLIKLQAWGYIYRTPPVAASLMPVLLTWICFT